MDNSFKTADIKVGVVGLGLMGSCISVALAVSGHPVIAVAPIEEDLLKAPDYIKQEIAHCSDAGLISENGEIYRRITITDKYNDLAGCSVVFECVSEQLKIKKAVYSKMAEHVSNDTVIASNTSALPISLLQQLIPHPERFMGIHWAEPAYLTRFMELTCGQHTSYEIALKMYDLAHSWNKEPTLLRKDIRGFITNRLMYALYREAIHLAETGVISFEDLDRCLKHDMGAWMTFMGIFRKLDYDGMQDYENVIRSILLTLCNEENVPQIMEEKMKENALGTKNGNGIYRYINGEAQAWEDAFANFNKDIYHLAKFYPSEKTKT